MPPRNPYVKVSALSDNALAKQALDAVKEIDTEASKKKLAQLELLKPARARIQERLDELNHQVAQIDKVITAIAGAQAPPREKTGRRDLREVRERVAVLLEARKGQKFNAGDLVREFPELEGVSISFVVKPLVEAGKVHIDKSDGAKRLKYFAPAG